MVKSNSSTVRKLTEEQLSEIINVNLFINIHVTSSNRPKLHFQLLLKKKNRQVTNRIEILQFKILKIRYLIFLIQLQFK